MEPRTWTGIQDFGSGGMEAMACAARVAAPSSPIPTKVDRLHLRSSSGFLFCFGFKSLQQRRLSSLLPPLPFPTLSIYCCPQLTWGWVEGDSESLLPCFSWAACGPMLGKRHRQHRWVPFPHSCSWTGREHQGGGGRGDLITAANVLS